MVTITNYNRQPPTLPEELWLGKVGGRISVETFTNEKDAVEWMKGSNPFVEARHIWRVRVEIQEAYTTVGTVDRLEQS